MGTCTLWLWSITPEGKAAQRGRDRAGGSCPDQAGLGGQEGISSCPHASEAVWAGRFGADISRWAQSSPDQLLQRYSKAPNAVYYSHAHSSHAAPQQPVPGEQQETGIHVAGKHPPARNRTLIPRLLGWMRPRAAGAGLGQGAESGFAVGIGEQEPRVKGVQSVVRAPLGVFWLFLG